MALSIDKQTLISISLGGLAGVITAVATGSFWISKQLVELEQTKVALAQTQTDVQWLKCRERETKAALEHAAATMEQVAIIADSAPGNVRSRAAPQLQKLQRWAERTEC